MKVDLADKVALVTGAARGIGKSIANTLSENGADVIFADIDFEQAAETTLEATRTYGGNNKPLQMDVRDSDQVELSIETILADFGHLDILVNNAGVNTLAHRVNIDKFP